MFDKRCISCGDPITKPRKTDSLDVLDAMQVRCRECAKEVLGIQLPFIGTLQHGAGGGRRVIKDTKTLS